ncbi:uncharacterized protein F5147DRAFT_588416 [Suillus discolor]|uniref:Uncharacterized protein n=1 Tax=Suillus discolor TaxID=1912936 RepID=A0A9P7ERG1_9AGAM|nr:uncharacterized protein F5147DRAFT_588416 [Suillus discolor]KAG2086758.1 hypothetical protein F5147DRAFT_588416 [Suillus discolor]
MNAWRENSLLERYPLVAQLILERPTVVLDKFGVIVLWYLPRAIDVTIQNDMLAVTMMMLDHLGKSVSRTAATKGKWRTHESNFQTSEHGLTPGCINLSPGWFLQGHPVHWHFTPESTCSCQQAPKFHPEVSVTLKEDGSTLCQAIRRPAVLAAAALRFMHGGLYWSSLTTQLGLGIWADNNQLMDMGNCLRQWASSFTVLAVMCNRCSPLHRDSQSLAQWFDIMTSIGDYGPVRMKFPNISVEIAYNSGVMVGTLGNIVRHGVDRVNGDRVSWVWYMRDDVHKFVDVPREDYSKYESIIADAFCCR